MARRWSAGGEWSDLESPELERELESALGPFGAYDVLGWPGAALQSPLRPGDVLVRVVSDPPALVVAQLAGHGLRSAAALPPGAEVEGDPDDAEGGYSPARVRSPGGWDDAPTYARVVGPDGLLARNQIVLRPASPRPAAPVEDASADREDEPAPFQLARFPEAVRDAFRKGPAAWLEAVKAAVTGTTSLAPLADVAFFARHPERMSGGVGRLIDAREEGFHELRAEWELYRIIVERIVRPSARPSVFLPARTGGGYEGWIAAPTTGRVALMVNGRNADGAGGHEDAVDAFRRMQTAVEALGAGDSLLIANWQFNPTMLRLAGDPSRSWGDLLLDKAREGVQIRVLVSKHPFHKPFESDLDALDALIGKLDLAKRDNFKYVFSKHPHLWGTHHQKVLVARKARGSVVAFLGGLDLSFVRGPEGWSEGFVWHDVEAQVEGLAARDLERELVERWNREKGGSAAVHEPLAGWKAFEDLAQAPLVEVDRAPAVNGHRLQVLRTVSVGDDPASVRRDDIWRGYFRLVGRATRFLYLENQYLHEPKLAEAIVRQAEAQPELIVLIVVGTGTDDRETVDPNASWIDRRIQTVEVEITQNEFALRREFFQRLSVAPLTPDRLRVYTLSYSGGITHSKLILADDEALSIGSANANPRGFFFDTEVNVTLDDPEAVRSFRHRLWAHDLGLDPAKVAAWPVSEFFTRWDAVAAANQKALAKPARRIGEGIIAFHPLDPTDPRFRAGKRTGHPKTWF